MDDGDFVYQDFAVVTAPQIDVLMAAARLRVEAFAPGLRTFGAQSAFEAEPEGSGTAAGGKPGLFGRIGRIGQWWFGDRLGRNASGTADSGDPEPTLYLHVDDEAETERMISWTPERMAYANPVETRVSALARRPTWTLVEFADPVSGMSMVSYALSADLAGADVYYFRRSGALAAETHFDFHHYLDGNQRRRVMSHLTIPSGPDAEPWWEGYVDGLPAPFENPLLYDGAVEANILTEEKQAILLDALGLPLERIFGRGGRIDPVLISDKPGGAPIGTLFD